MFITINMNGNVHEAISTLNRRWYASYLFSLAAISSGMTVIVLKVPDRGDFDTIWNELGYIPEKNPNWKG